MGIVEIRASKGLGAINEVYKQKPAEKEFKIGAPKMPKPINPVSLTQKEIKTQLKKMYPVFLSTRKRCEIDGPNCTKKSTCIHHTEGRAQSIVLDATKWMASCGPCNSWVESADAEARAKGFKKSKHAKS